MARAIASDLYQAFRFVVDLVVPGTPTAISAGFATCTLPELTVESAEYKSGLMTYKQKYPGAPTVNDVTLTRGLMKANTDLFKIVKQSFDPDTAAAEYRFDLNITQKHRDGSAIVYTLKNAFGLRAKLGTDLDANSNDVSVEEMDVQYESFSFVHMPKGSVVWYSDTAPVA